MQGWTVWARGALASAALMGAVACAPGGADDARPERLADVVVPDADFTFATTKTVQLELQTAADEAIEVADADGRRVMDGAFAAGARLDLKVPVGTQQLTVRTRRGADTLQRDVAIAADGRAVAGQ